MRYQNDDIPLPLFRGAPPPPTRKNEPEPEFVPAPQPLPPEPEPIQEVPPSTPPPATPPPSTPPQMHPGAPVSPWETTPAERENYKMIFMQQDMDRDGFINGGDGVQFFRLSGLPDAVLGQIWGLADIDHDGRLDASEFIVAMHLITCVSKRVLFNLFRCYHYHKYFHQN